MNSFSKRLREALIKRNMKASTLSYKTEISESTISHYLKGHYIPKSDKIQVMAKALRVSPSWLSGFDVDPDDETENPRKSLLIPVYGYVAAGIPIEAITDILDYEELSPALLKDGSEYFALLIKGDSMEPLIPDGGTVIVRQQPDVDSGQIAIVCVNGDHATCKKIMKHPTGIWLQPLNPSYEPVFYSNEEIQDLPITILGRVVELRLTFT